VRFYDLPIVRRRGLELSPELASDRRNFSVSCESSFAFTEPALHATHLGGLGRGESHEVAVCELPTGLFNGLQISRLRLFFDLAEDDAGDLVLYCIRQLPQALKGLLKQFGHDQILTCLSEFDSEFRPSSNMQRLFSFVGIADY
jgi:hypothetical protein